MFDSHCHLHDHRMAAVRDEAVARALDAGVTGVLLAGVDEASWRDEDAVAAAYPQLDVAVAYGIHPQVVPLLSDEDLDRQLAALALRIDERRPHAIGEIGLDALGQAHKDSLARQERVFVAQLQLSNRARLPVVLHILRSHPQAIRLLKAHPPPAGGVVHSYSGPAELVPRYLELGLSISFAGPITYENARRALLAARAVPIERLLVETDAPDQTPVPLRPAPNEPAALRHVLSALGAARGDDPDALARQTEDNARRLFGCPVRRRAGQGTAAAG